MNKFPAEALILIFKHLRLEQKLECMLVCRAWAQVLLQGHLFEIINLSCSSSSEPFYQYLESLLKKKKGKDDMYPGKKFKRLLTDNMDDNAINAASLATSFPRLTFLYSSQSMTYNPKSRRLRSIALDSDPFLGWRTSLETLIDENYSRSALFNILKIGAFCRLTTLKIRSLSDILIPQLKNTPALINLSISISEISLIHLENLHSTVSELTSLTLKSTLSSGHEQTVLFNIVPAEKIKALTLACWHFVYPILNSDPFASYVKLKYTRLNKFSCVTSVQTTPNQIGNIFTDSKFAEFITTGGSVLRKCIVSLNDKSVETVDLMEKYMTQLENLGIDMFGCKNIFEKVKSVREDSKYPVPAESELRKIKSINFDKFNHLKELTIDFSKKPHWYSPFFGITIGEIVSTLPQTVATLCLKENDIIIFQEIETLQCSSSIVNFKLHYVKVIGEGISTCLAHHFPKLKSLIVKYCNLNDTDTIDLPDHHLDYAEFMPYQKFIYSTKVYFKLTIPSRVLYYKLPSIYHTIQ